jgi:ketosteroid isomerase-like protein
MMLRTVLVVGCAVAALVPQASAAGNDDLQAIQIQLDEATRGLREATLKGDGPTMLSYFAEDAISMPNYGPLVRGKEAIRARGQDMEKMGFTFKSTDFRRSDLWTCGNLVYELGTYDMSFCMGDTTKILTDSGKFLTVWAIQPDGNVKIKVETWNADAYPCRP